MNSPFAIWNPRSDSFTSSESSRNLWKMQNAGRDYRLGVIVPKKCTCLGKIRRRRILHSKVPHAATTLDDLNLFVPI